MVDWIFALWECSDSQNYNLNQDIAQHVPSEQPVICLVCNSFSGLNLNNSKPQFHLHCRWSAQRPWEIPHGDRGRSAISIQGGPLIVINGVLTPYKWPDINRWLGWFHPWVFGPTLPWWLHLRYTGGWNLPLIISHTWNRSKNSQKNPDLPNVRNPTCSRTLTWTPKHPSFLHFVGPYNSPKNQHETYAITLPETNIAPENEPSQKEMNLPTIDVPGYVSFTEGSGL